MKRDAPESFLALLESIDENSLVTLESFAKELSDGKDFVPKKISEIGHKIGLSSDTLSAYVSETVSMREAMIEFNEDAGANWLLEQIFQSLGITEVDTLEARAVKALVTLAESPAIDNFAKFMRLAYDHPRALKKISLTVDSRPFFDFGREKTIGYIILPTLVIDYTDDETRNTLQLKIAEEQLDQIIEELKAARNKINIIENEIAQSTGKPVIKVSDLN